MLTPVLKLVEIPGVTADPMSVWNIRALEVNGTSISIAVMAQLAESEPKNFKKIRTSLRVAALSEHCKNERYVVSSDNFPGVYEARAHALKARMMFFYSKRDRAIVCTNGCWKSSDNQEKAFSDSFDFKKLYEESHANKSPKKPR